jgi:hypothetical protein
MCRVRAKGTSRSRARSRCLWPASRLPLLLPSLPATHSTAASSPAELGSHNLTASIAAGDNGHQPTHNVPGLLRELFGMRSDLHLLGSKRLGINSQRTTRRGH